MNTAPTRPELDAKLELIETRMDARAQRIEQRMDYVVEQLRDTRLDIKNMRWWMIGTALSTVLAVAGLNYQLIQSMATSFASGTTAGAQMNQITEELRRISGRLDSMERQTVSVTPSGASPAPPGK